MWLLTVPVLGATRIRELSLSSMEPVYYTP
jgi:hypothetical protein